MIVGFFSHLVFRDSGSVNCISTFKGIGSWSHLSF